MLYIYLHIYVDDIYIYIYILSIKDDPTARSARPCAALGLKVWTERKALRASCLLGSLLKDPVIYCTPNFEIFWDILNYRSIGSVTSVPCKCCNFHFGPHQAEVGSFPPNAPTQSASSKRTFAHLKICWLSPRNGYTSVADWWGVCRCRHWAGHGLKRSWAQSKHDSPVQCNVSVGWQHLVSNFNWRFFTSLSLCLSMCFFWGSWFLMKPNELPKLLLQDSLISSIYWTTTAWYCGHFCGECANTVLLYYVLQCLRSTCLSLKRGP